jgi:general secretion pathway protein A
MYREFYGLRERPFDLTPNPRYLVLTQAHREALGHLEYGIASRKGMTLLVGEAGTGKTTLIRTAIERQPARVHCVHLPNPALTRDEFLQMLAARFGLSDEAGRSKTSLLIELEALLRRQREAGEASVLVVDEAQSVPYELLEEIRLLANIETEEEKLLTVILAGQPELTDRMNDESLRQLKQRIALRCELRALTRTETPAYVAGRIRAAGGVAAQLFTREAVMLMHDAARGIPRAISVIADNAMVTGFALAQRPITSATIRVVCRDLDLTGGLEPPSERAANQPRPEQSPGPMWSFVTTAPGSPVSDHAGDPADRGARTPADRTAKPSERAGQPAGRTAEPADRLGPGAAEDRLRDSDWTPQAVTGTFDGPPSKRRRFLFF